MAEISLAGVYSGIASIIEAHNSIVVTLAGFAITTVPAYLSKRKAWLDTINMDVQKYIDASIQPGDTGGGLAAQWNEQKSIDTSAMNVDTSTLNSLVENAKSDAQANEANMQTAIASQEPVSQYLKALLNLVSSGLG